MVSSQNDYVLGLDVGSNSLGWCLVREVPLVNTTPNVIAGVIVFPAGVNEKGVITSKMAERRLARGARRTHQRKSRRKHKLCKTLQDARLFPVDPAAIAELQETDPYKIRARGLDHKLELYEIGRALTHLNSRRGYKSNRKANTDEPEVADATGKKPNEHREELTRLIKETNSRTVGEYLARHIPLKFDRRRAQHLTRAMIAKEFEMLWKAQALYYPDLMTPEVKVPVADAIFFQRPFDQGDRLVGFCEFEPRQKRARLGHRLYQQFRILQDLGNLRVIPGIRQERKLTLEERDTLFDYLDKHATMSLKIVRKVLQLDDSARFNCERGKKDDLKGNATEEALAKAFGARWTTLSETEKNNICEALMDADDLEEFATEWQVDDESMKILSKKMPTDKHGSLSLCAINKLLPHMMKGCDLYEARVQAGYEDKPKIEAFRRLPFAPGTKFNKHVSSHLIEQRLLLPDQDEINNPTVKKALVIVRKLVNAVIDEYGMPKAIRVELAREAKGGIRERNEATALNNRRDRDRQRIEKELKKIGINEPSRNDVLKYRLYEECGGQCPYTGRMIDPASQLFHASDFEIEHIIPYPRCLDDSFLNKTLCYRPENQQKKRNQTPFEAYSGDPAKYEEIQGRIRKFKPDCSGRSLAYKKLQKFQLQEINTDKFIERQLNDTRYISKQVRAYLQCLPTRVMVSSGHVTAELRHQWGLNSILAPTTERKSDARADHRHHAVDAAVIALTTTAHVKALSSKFKLKSHGEREHNEISSPWFNYGGANFRNDVADVVRNINVCHCPTRKVKGRLHEAINYGSTDKPNLFTTRKLLTDLTFPMVKSEAIRDKTIRDMIRRRLDEKGIDWQNTKGSTKLPPDACFETEPLVMPGAHIPIRKIRINVTENKMLPINDGNGNAYSYAVPGGNHHLQFFEWDEQGKAKRGAVVTTLFEAARRVKAKESIYNHRHPAQLDAKLLITLHKNDMVEIKDGDKPVKLCRVQIISMAGKTPKVTYRLHTASNIDNPDTEIYIQRASGFEIQRVKIDYLGRMHPDN